MPGTSTLVSTASLIINPTAGQVESGLVDALIGRCRAEGIEPELCWTGGPGQAEQLAGAAAASRTDLIVAVGGDGTVGEVAQGMLRAGEADQLPSLLVVPAGTGNSNYLAHWGPLEWPDAVTAALTGQGVRRRRLDLARLVELDHLVLLGACSGLIAEALAVARSVPVAGPPRYRIALADAAGRFTPYPGRVLVDGAVVHEGLTVLANVGGGRHRGGTYEVLPDSILDDGLLDVCVIGDAIAPDQVPALTLDGGHLGEPGVVYARGRQITVERTDGQPISFEHDGELQTGILTRFSLQVLPGALPVLCRADQPGFSRG